MIVEDAAPPISLAPAPARERRARVAGGLDGGLPDHWYPILRADKLRQKPLRLRRFGQTLALWRDAQGRPHLFQDACPHRGASLSLGQVHGDQLACWYHGWRFDAAGACTLTPLEPPDSTRKDRICVTSYPTEERGGYIWAFYGDPAHRTPLTLVPYELEDPRWSVFRQEYVWPTNWLNILDNVLDPLHAIFVHAGVATQRKRAKFYSFRVTHETECAFRLGRLGYLDDGSIAPVEGETEFILPNVLRLDLADGTRRGIMRIVMLPTPIDEHRSYLVYLQARRVRGVSRLHWQTTWWTRWWRAQNLIKWQDKTLLSTLGPVGDVRLREHMAASDHGVIHLRRVLNRAYARAAAGEPPPVPSPTAHTHAANLFAPWEHDPDD
jgi:phenylpropionate dioxygenase-like ring-hydroxylating dioxygenase large terminal subunit